MIEIGKTYVDVNANPGFARLCAQIRIGDKATSLWLEVPESYASYLTLRADAFLAALLPTALRRGLDIVCRDPVSEQLFYQLSMYCIPTLARRVSDLREIKIYAQSTAEPLSCALSVGAGFSGGLDSMYTLMTHESCSEGFRVSHLVTVNTNSPAEGGETTNFAGICRRGKAFAEEYGYKFLPINANFWENLREQYTFNNVPYMPAVLTYRFASAALALQGLFGVYYLSSSATFWQSDIPADTVSASAEFDNFLLDCFSTRSLRFYSSGAQSERSDKAAAIGDWEPSYRYLHPCGVDKTGERNCGRCRKCLSLMALLYAKGTLDNYGTVFDVEDFKANFEENIASVLAPLNDSDGGSYKKVLRTALPELAAKTERRSRQIAASASAARAYLLAKENKIK